MSAATATAPGEVLVVDDHELVTAALVMALAIREMRAWSLPPAALADRVPTAATPHSLVLLDLDLGTPAGARTPLAGERFVAPLRQAGWRVLVLTGSTDLRRVGAALAAGAEGWLPKSAPFAQLAELTVKVCAGRATVACPDRDRLVALARAAEQSEHELRARWERLTTREREVLARLVDGQRASAIAAHFVVSLATVRTQIKSILAKLQVNSQLEAVHLAHRLR